MSKPRAPGLDARRESDFRAALLARAHAWLPDWHAQDGAPDFARALLEIAARFDAEVAERLDHGGEKMALGLLDWLALRGQAAIPARMPVVFTLANGAPAVSATAPVRLQAGAVTFETDTNVRLIPARLAMVVGADPENDAWFLPPPGLSSLDPLGPLPVAWRLTSFAAPTADRLQLDPALGLAKDMLVEIEGRQFRIGEVKDDLARIEPAVPGGAGFAAGSAVSKVGAFNPFGAGLNNWQEHALYIGHRDYLDISATALIEVTGVAGLGDAAAWHYWGKVNGADAIGWQAFTPPAAGRALHKPAGSLELLRIGDKQSRWIRASMPTVTAPAFPVTTDAIAMKINPADLHKECGLPTELDTAATDLEALNNNTALVLGDAFYPLGREPRLFDTFYLGSKETFSKRGADVRICIDMADSAFESLATLDAGPLASPFLAGVAQDGYLHLFVFDVARERLLHYPNRKPLRPPLPSLEPIEGGGVSVKLDPRPPYRPPVWTDTTLPANILVAVVAAGSVWLWKEDLAAPAASGWSALGVAGPATVPPTAVDALIFVANSGQGVLVALAGQKLYTRAPFATAGTAWQAAEVKHNGAAILLDQIGAIGFQAGAITLGPQPDKLLGISSTGSLFLITLAPGLLQGSCEELFIDADPSVVPAGANILGQLTVVAVGKDNSGSRALHAYMDSGGVHKHGYAQIGYAAAGHSICAGIVFGRLAFALSLGLASGRRGLAWWAPFDTAIAPTLFTAEIPEATGIAVGSPALLDEHVVLPAASGKVLVAPYAWRAQQNLYTKLKTAVVTALADMPFDAGDRLVVKIGTAAAIEAGEIAAGPEHAGGESMYQLTGPFSAAQSFDRTILGYRSSKAGLTATVGSALLIGLDTLDTTTQAGTRLLIRTSVSTNFYTVISVSNATPPAATLGSALDAIDVIVTYWIPEEGKGRVAPLMLLNPATNGNWDAALLERTMLGFPGATPDRQHGKAFQTDAGNHPEKIVFDLEWQVAPPVESQGTRFVVDASVGRWTGQLGAVAANPELSWEYWNGTAWWKLPRLSDGTQNLKTSGAIHFVVPADLQPTDWSGKTNAWIRARLVGGDYGQARSVVMTVPRQSGGTEQTVERVTDAISAPEVLGVHVEYALNAAVKPEFVLTADNGTVRDQSDANMVTGALVTMFMPLASVLSAPAPTGGAPCATGCDCAGPSTAPAAASAPPPTRALYLGFDGELAGQPVNLLFVVDREQPHDAFAPLVVEALNGDRFVPVVAEDGTRALGETGMLSMSLSVAPVSTSLFGRSLSWLRLTPREAAGDWNPSLRGVYVNAAWAHAAETMTRERLGSSTGAPGQQLQLARPPLLQDSLELRVREPLSGEEREALLRADPDSVRSDVAEDLRGHWVLWRQVADPTDSGPGERVYALDEATGIVLFGDGLHGAIPPPGRDAVVAFSYRRTEAQDGPGPLPANMVAPRTELSLVSPVQGVEKAVAADQSAGGAAPEDAQRVLRFAPARLRHRGRALTLRDFEELALQTTPAIAQARAFADGGGVRLVVAMRGDDAQPGQSAKRELKRTLLALAPLRLAARNALRVTGPVVRRLRVDLVLRVASLDASGALSSYAKDKVRAFFDTASGGLAGDGWALGATPSGDDIALALIDAPNLEGIEDVTLSEIGSDGSASAWRTAVGPGQLAVPAGDGLRIEFVVMEAQA